MVTWSSPHSAAPGFCWGHLLIDSPSPFPFSCGSDGKESACNAEDLNSIPGWGRFPWRREWQPTLVFLPGESHGQKYSLWGSKELDTTERLTPSPYPTPPPLGLELLREGVSLCFVLHWAQQSLKWPCHGTDLQECVDQTIYVLVWFCYFVTQHVGSYFPDQGLNLCPLQ